MIFNYQNNNIFIKITRIGVVGGEMWQTGTGKWGPRRRKLDVRPGTGTFQAQIFSAGQSKGYFWVLGLGGARTGSCTQFTSQIHPH